MLVDIALVKNHIKPKATSTLRNMKKDDLIEYIRTLEYNYNTAVSFNNQQAENFLKFCEEAEAALTGKGGDGMNLSEHEVSGQLCWSCQNACGGCSWTELNHDTKKPRFEPVPGWIANPIRKNFGSHKSGPVIMDTYAIKACPLYVPDDTSRIQRNGSVK